ncbi:cyclic nucleotide-binding domain-containing protein [bacterium]|nr:cyclic nucleotide-binding domain-containing protein [bacterium]
MLLNEEVQILRQVPLLAGASPAHLKLLAFTSDRLRYEAGATLFRQGEAGDVAYIILSGTADVLVTSPRGEIRVAQVSAPSLVGEISILCDVARTATVRAATPIEVLRVRKEEFLKLMQDFPDVALQVVRVLAGRLARTTAELTEARASQLPAQD